MTDSAPSAQSIIDALGLTEIFYGTNGNPLSITYSFLLSIPDYYHLTAYQSLVSDLYGFDINNPNSFGVFTENQRVATFLATYAWEAVVNIRFSNAGDNNPLGVYRTYK